MLLGCSAPVCACGQAPVRCLVARHGLLAKLSCLRCVLYTGCCAQSCLMAITLHYKPENAQVRGELAAAQLSGGACDWPAGHVWSVLCVQSARLLLQASNQSQTDLVPFFSTLSAPSPRRYMPHAPRRRQATGSALPAAWSQRRRSGPRCATCGAPLRASCRPFGGWQLGRQCHVVVLRLMGRRTACCS